MPSNATRLVAVLTCIGSVAYFCFAFLPALLHRVSVNDIRDYTQFVPILYVSGAAALSLVILLRPPRRPPVQYLVRGWMIGACLAYLLIALRYFLTDPVQRQDGTFRWATFYVTLLYLGPFLSTFMAAAHLAYVAFRQIRCAESIGS